MFPLETLLYSDESLRTESSRTVGDHTTSTPTAPPKISEPRALDALGPNYTAQTHDGQNGAGESVIDQEDAYAGAHYGNTSGFHKRAFDHPALWKACPTIWIADDALGIGRSEVARIRAAGVDASCDYATLDKDGKLAVTRGPPDEAWYDGMTK